MQRFHRLIRLRPARRRMIVTALVTVALVRLALSVIGFERTQRLLAAWAAPGAGGHGLTPGDDEAVHDLVWAVRVSSEHVPGASCLTQGLAARALLARHGIESHLRIGVARDHSGALQAHAWVERGERIILGGLDDLNRYTRVHTSSRRTG